MNQKVGVDFGFFFWEVEFDSTDHQRENWSKFLNKLSDFRMLSSSMNAEYIGKVMSAVVRLRNDVLPTAFDALKADDPLRKSYEKIQRGIRDFLSSVRGIDEKILRDENACLTAVQPIGHQWTFVAALERLRDVVVREVRQNCQLLQLEVPEEFQDGFRVPESIADEWANEVASSLYSD